MPKSEFDSHIEQYEANHTKNILITGESPSFFTKYKINDVAEICKSDKPQKILDFGAGLGSSLPYWREEFPQSQIICMDVSFLSLLTAKKKYTDTASYCLFDGQKIPVADNTFDIIFASCVFHHIDEELHVNVLRELRRILRNGGTFILFEHNPFNPLTRHAVNTCPFDANAVLITARQMRKRMREVGYVNISLAYRIFFPRALRALRKFEKQLTLIPLGAQYRLYSRK